MDLFAMHSILANTFGPNAGPSGPDTFDVVLLASRNTSDEIPGGTGYVRGALARADFGEPADGVVVSDPVAVGTPTGAWEIARYVVLYDATLDAWWNPVQLTEPLTVTGAGDPVAVQVALTVTDLIQG